jgi:CRP/FNR family transcriptional regulator, cyclic AMP receptor protein
VVHSRAKEPVVINTLNEGEVFGWSWLVPPYRYFADARAVTAVSATALDSACLRDKCEADTELGYQLLKRVATVMHHHMQAARLRLLDLYVVRIRAKSAKTDRGAIRAASRST